MISKIAALVILSMIMAGMSAFCGCGGGGMGDCEENMKMVPVDSIAYSYWNIGIMESDEELWDMYYIFKESAQAEQITDMGLPRSAIDDASKALLGFGSLVNATVRVMKGDFKAQDVERYLEKEGYQKSTYQEIGIWTPPAGKGYEPMAVKDNTLLMGQEAALQAAIDVMIKSEKKSLYDNQNIKLVVDRLPAGILVYLGTAASAGEESYEDLVAYGKSLRMADEDRLHLTAVYMFQDAFTAGNAEGSIKDYLGTQNFTDIKAERQDNFIKVTAKVYISDFVSTLVF